MEREYISNLLGSGSCLGNGFGLYLDPHLKSSAGQFFLFACLQNISCIGFV